MCLIYHSENLWVNTREYLDALCSFNTEEIRVLEIKYDMSFSFNTYTMHTHTHTHFQLFTWGTSVQVCVYGPVQGLKLQRGAVCLKLDQVSRLYRMAAASGLSAGLRWLSLLTPATSPHLSGPYLTPSAPWVAGCQ